MSRHGGDATAIAREAGKRREDFIDLSASMNPVAPDVRPLIARALDAVLDYPDGSRATIAFAEVLGEDPARLVLTNGGAEAIALVAQHLRVGAIVEPEFSLYRRYLERIEDGGLRWRSNPSNPLGRLAPPNVDAAVWDEAFYPLATGRWTGGRGEWRLGSLTKLWSCPGLRLGYVIAPDADSAAAIDRRRPEWSVNALALAVIEPLLSMTDLPAWSSEIASLRTEFSLGLRNAGFTATPTDANWLLIEGVDAPALRQQLIARGVVVRDCTSFGLADTCRVAVPHPRDIDNVVSAFEST